MKPTRLLLSRLQALFLRHRWDREMSEEIATHVAFETERNLARGMNPKAARAAALRSFGGVAQCMEEERDARGWRWLDDLIGDLRYGWRQLRRSPGFTITAILTLALGIGGTTAIFSIVHTLILHPLPFPHAERLVLVSENAPTGPSGSCGGSFTDWSEHQEHFTHLGAFHSIDRNLVGLGEPQQVTGWEVTADYLNVFGLKPALGRLFDPADDAPGGNHRVAILTHDFWQRNFAGDADVLGRTLELDGSPYEIVGVLPPHSLLADNVDYLSPAGILTQAYKTERNYGYVTTTVGLLKPGVSLELAAAQLSAVKESVNDLYPAYKREWTVSVQNLQEALFGTQRSPLYILLGAVGAVLLIACVNVANLFLARTTAREHELAMRLALGAGRGRLIRQILTESLLLSILGGIAGVALAACTIDPLVRFGDLDQLSYLHFGLDRSVLLFGFLATMLSGLLFGLAPALRSSRQRLGAQIKAGQRGVTRGHHRLQSSLIVAEIALTVVLLLSAGLLMRSLIAVANEETGFATEGLLMFQVAQSGETAQTIEKRVQFTDAILRELHAIPGVESAGMISCPPMNGRNFFGDSMFRTDRPETEGDFRGGFDCVSGDYFPTMHIPLRRGRLLVDADNRVDAPKVMVVSEAFVETHFDPGEDPLGHHITFKGDPWEIVGVVGNVRRFTLEGPPSAQVYIPQAQFPWHTHYIVRTSLPPLALATQVRAAVRAVNPRQPIANLGTLQDAARATLNGRVQMLTLLGIFAVVALLLACIGTYGVMAYNVGQRTREIGVRIALGATPDRILRQILGEGLKLVLLGLGLGAIGAIFATRAIASNLYQTDRFDPLVLVGVFAVLLGVGILASFLPARRATRLAPLEALRAE